MTGELSTDILSALGAANEETTTVLPALRHLRVREPLAMYGPSWDGVRSFIAPRWLSRRPVQVNAPSYLCHICRGTFEQPQQLKRHLIETYGYRILCSYCSDFECAPEHNELSRAHLENKHPEVAQNDALISNRSLTSFRPSQVDSLVNRHSYLRAPYFFSESFSPSRPEDT